MAATSRTKKSSSRPASSRNGAGANNRRSSSARSRSASISRASRSRSQGARSRQSQNGPTGAVENVAAKARDNGGAIVKGAFGAIAGTVAVGLAGRAVMKRARRPRVLGVPVPRGMVPRKLSVKTVAKQIGDVADRVERTSEDVQRASAQAKQLSKTLS